MDIPNELAQGWCFSRERERERERERKSVVCVCGSIRTLLALSNMKFTQTCLSKRDLCICLVGLHNGKIQGLQVQLGPGPQKCQQDQVILFFLKAWLISNVVLVSGVQQSDSVFYICAVLGLVAQSCPTLCDLTICSSPGSSVHGDSPGKNTGMGCHAFLQGSSQPSDRT